MCVGWSVYSSRVAIHFRVHIHIRVNFYVRVHFCVHVTLLRMRAHRIVATLTWNVQARKPCPQIPTACAIALAIAGTFSGGLTLDSVLRNCGPAAIALVGTFSGEVTLDLVLRNCHGTWTICGKCQFRPAIFVLNRNMSVVYVHTSLGMDHKLWRKVAYFRH